MIRFFDTVKLRWLRSRAAKLAVGFAVLVVLAGAGVAMGVMRLRSSARPFLHDDLATLPKNHVGLVLGCSPWLGSGERSPYFTARVAAAVTLFETGKVDYLLVSGDNGTIAYDEPTEFRRALLAAGVPDERIVLDYAGFRTLDSVVRAREVFGQSRFTVISQRFHNERAVYLARAHGIEAVGFSAGDVGGRRGARTRLREWFARARAVIDLVLGVEPKFLGPKVVIPS